MVGLELVDVVRLKEESGINVYYLVVCDLVSLFELVQFNVLEFYLWGSYVEVFEQVDWVVFDLDLGLDVFFVEVKKVVIDICKLLVQLELELFLCVFGGKGLYVVVLFNLGCDWDLIKCFVKGFVEVLV